MRNISLNKVSLKNIKSQYGHSAKKVLWYFGSLSDLKLQKKMAKFALSLLDKPFANGLGKILNENALVAQIYLPISEFRHFLDCLTQLYKDGILKSYEFVIQDRRKGKWSRETIPFEDFKDGKWIYNHNKHIQDVRRLVEQQDFEATTLHRVKREK